MKRILTIVVLFCVTLAGCIASPAEDSAPAFEVRGHEWTAVLKPGQGAQRANASWAYEIELSRDDLETTDQLPRMPFRVEAGGGSSPEAATLTGHYVLRFNEEVVYQYQDIYHAPVRLPNQTYIGESLGGKPALTHNIPQSSLVRGSNEIRIDIEFQLEAEHGNGSTTYFELSYGPVKHYAIRKSLP